MENYEFVCQIGKGNFGRISKIIRKSDKKTLIWKELDYGQMSEKEKEQIVSEVNILRELKHPNIVRYYDRIIDKKHSRIYIIMEYCEGGDLNQLIKRCKKTGEFIAEDIIWKIFTQVLLAIHVIHNHKEGKILHRDIKPSNIFLDKDNNVKLGDFGLSRELSDQSKFAYSHVGTPYYMSPEQIDETKYNEKSDIWSLGCFLYELTTFHPPFEAKNQIMLAMRIKSGKVEKINKRYSEELWRVITWMLTVNSNERPSSEDLLNIPEVCVRLREKRIKDTLYKLKMFEEKLNLKDKEQKDKENILNERERNLEKKENELKQKEEELREKELELKEKENELKEKEKKIKNVSSISNGTTTGYSNNMNNSNSNSNNNYMNSNNNVDIYNIKNSTIKNMINNNSDLNSLLMYSTKNNYSNSTNSNSNNLLLPANTNTSINNISLINNNTNNNNINNETNQFILSNNNNINEVNKHSVKKSLIGLVEDYSNNINNSNNYSNNNFNSNKIYSEYFGNKFKTSINNNINEHENLNFNDSAIRNEFTKVKNSNLNMSNISNSSTNKRNNVSGSFINTLKQKISKSFLNEENNFFHLYENKNSKEKEKENKMIYEDKNSPNSFAKKINEYDISNFDNKEKKENNSIDCNINLNKTMKYNIKNNKLMKGGDIENEIDLTSKNSGIPNFKSTNDIEQRNGVFNEYDNYSNIISQINNINTKYGPPSKVVMSTKNSMINNKTNFDIPNANLNNSNIINNVNNFNSNLLQKSSKNETSNKSNINNIKNQNPNKNIKSVSNMDRIGGINNFNKRELVSNTHDFEIANKIGYETGRPNTHCGINQAFSNNNNNNTNSGINNMARNGNIGRESRINTLRNNNTKRAKTPIMNKINGRNIDNTPNKYNNNELNNNRAQKIEYGINNYYTNANDKNRSMVDNSNNNNIQKINHRQIEIKNNDKDKSKTINSSCRNKSGNYTSYRKKK